jgi:hypothetical protein
MYHVARIFIILLSVPEGLLTVGLNLEVFGS